MEIQKAVNFFSNQEKGSVSYRRVTSARKAYWIMSRMFNVLESDNPQSFSAWESKIGRKMVSVRTDQDTFVGFYNAETKTLEVYIKKFPRERVDLNGVRPSNYKPKVKKTVNLAFINFEPLVIRKKVSTRGGGVEIDLTDLGYPGERMTAYQNYLSGGMLGSIANSCTTEWNDDLRNIGNQLKAYFSELAHGTSGEEFNGLPISAY